MAFLSDLLGSIESKTVLGKKSKKYVECYNAYHIIENIDWSIVEAREKINHINTIQNSKEKACSLLIVFRWLGYLFTENYYRNITDEEDIKERHNSVAILAQEDLREAVSNVLKILK